MPSPVAPAAVVDAPATPMELLPDAPPLPSATPPEFTLPAALAPPRVAALPAVIWAPPTVAAPPVNARPPPATTAVAVPPDGAPPDDEPPAVLPPNAALPDAELGLVPVVSRLHAPTNNEDPNSKPAPKQRDIISPYNCAPHRPKPQPAGRPPRATAAHWGRDAPGSHTTARPRTRAQVTG